MKCIDFNPSEHNQEIIEMARSWGQEYNVECLPKTGLIVPGIAAYFLYTTDSKVCFLEGLISNKNADKLEVRKALSILTYELVKKAKELGYLRAFATTNNPNVVIRAAQHGAQVKEKYCLLTLTL